LARQLNVSPAYLSQVENGKLPAPSHERILELSETLDVPPHRLFALAAKIPPNVTQLLERTPEAARFLTKADQLEFPAVGFHLLVEVLDRLGVDATLQLLESAVPAPEVATLHGRGASGPDYALAPLVHTNLVYADLGLGAWADVIDTLAESLVEHATGIGPDDIATPLTEEGYPDAVCIGGGVAVPHLSPKSLDKPLLAVARMRTPLKTTAEPSLRFVFLLLGTAEPAIRQLRHLARIVQICTSEEARSALESAADATELCNAILAADKSIQ
jgi:mannitol/fructose-specific phosphotransferase system IIA component (Ntr-type)/transcriptional regulator with XRE-family HTH domain